MRVCGLHILIAVLALTACSSKRERDRFEQRRRTLTVSQAITGDVKSESSTTAWNLVNVREINVSVCLEDQALRRSADKRKWRVQGGELNVAVESTPEGCLNWDERLEFEPSATPIFIPFTRKVTALDGSFDPLDIRFYLNPWSGLTSSERAVVDPAFTTVKTVASDGDALLSLKGEGRTGQIFVSSVKTELLGQPNMRLNLTFAAEIRVKAEDGTDKAVPVDSGRVTVEAVLAYRKKGSDVFDRLHTPILVKEHAFQNGTVYLQNLSVNDLKVVDRTQGSYHLLLKVVPVDGPRGLRSFGDVIDLGDWKGLKGGTFESQQKVDSGAAVVARTQVPENADFGFELNPIVGKPYGKDDENNIFRTANFTFVAKVNGDIIKKSLNGEKFEITSLESDNKKTQIAEVLDDKITWSDSVVHNYYSSMADAMTRRIRITRLKTGEWVERNLRIIPGVYNFLGVQDIGNQVAPNRKRRGQMQLLMEDACINLGDKSWTIDPVSQALEVSIYPRIMINPKVKRYDDPLRGASTGFEALRPGNYLLSIGFYNLDQTDFSKPFLVTHKKVTHDGGSLVTDFTIKSRELSFTRLRNYVVVQLHFLHPKTGELLPPGMIDLEIPPAIFNVNLKGDDCTIVVQPENFDNAKLRHLDLSQLSSGEEPEQTPVQSRKQWPDPTEEWDFNRISLDYLAKLGADPNTKKALEAGELIRGLDCANKVSEQDPKMPAICSYKDDTPLIDLCRAIAMKWRQNLGQPHSQIAALYYRRCFLEPKRFLTVRKYYEINEMEERNNAVVKEGLQRTALPISTKFTMGTDFGTEYMYERVSRLAVKGKANAKLIFRALGWVSRMPIPRAWKRGLKNVVDDVFSDRAGVTVSGSRALDSFRWIFNYQIPLRGIGFNDSSTLFVESLDAEFTVQRYRVCYTIEAAMEETEWRTLLVKAPIEQVAPRLYVCLPESENAARMKERYYFVYTEPEAQGAGTIQDPDRRNNRIFFQFRGERDYRVFLENLRPHMGHLYRNSRDNPEPLRAHIDSIRGANSLMDQINYPGVIAAFRPSLEHYDSISKLEGRVSQFIRWFNLELNPLNDNNAPIMPDQNDPKLRMYKRSWFYNNDKLIPNRSKDSTGSRAN